MKTKLLKNDIQAISAYHNNEKLLVKYYDFNGNEIWGSLDKKESPIVNKDDLNDTLSFYKHLVSVNRSVRRIGLNFIGREFRL